MCRLLAVKTAGGARANTADLLPRFAVMARASREYQGDGWGCSWWDGTRWERYRSVTPIWDDDLSKFGTQTMFLAHARSAFRNEGIEEANNMPFIAGDEAFVFNGELRGVRIAEEGRIGAEKLFNLLRRIGPRGSDEWRRAVATVSSRIRYVRAMNFIRATPHELLVTSIFNEDADYFTMSVRRGEDAVMVCSEPLAGLAGWAPIPNGTVETVT
jgi:glutamine amidotransferase